MPRKSYKKLYESAQNRITELFEKIEKMNVYENESQYWNKILDENKLTLEEAIKFVEKFIKEKDSNFSTNRIPNYLKYTLDQLKDPSQKENWKEYFIDLLKESHLMISEASMITDFFKQNRLQK